jgi:hypothetical protein
MLKITKQFLKNITTTRDKRQIVKIKKINAQMSIDFYRL